MKPTPLLRVLNALGDAGCNPRRSGKGYSARCPAHDDSKPSLSVSEGDDGRALVHCQAGCPVDSVIAALPGLTAADLFPPRATSSGAEVTATYPYTDERGELLFEVVRYASKAFKQRRPDGAGGWLWNLKGVPRVLYRLPEVLAGVAGGRTVFVAEGEKDVEALRAAGEVATCNPMGAGKWRAEHAEVLRGAAEVVIVADADEQGRAHARQVANSLSGRVGHVLIVEAITGKDAADHLGAGRTVDEFTVAFDSAEQHTGASHDGSPPDVGARLTHQLASLVKVVPPVWLWRCWLVAAAVQLLVGRQGTGKSTFAAWVVAQVSTGRPWPGDSERPPAVHCAILSLEEPAERLAARLTAAGADLAAVHILGQVLDHDDDGRPFQRPWRLPGDCGALETTIAELGVALVTIDGLGYSVQGDSHNYANVGSALSALAGVAERTGCAILGLTHPPKGNSDAVTAAIGSTAWTAIARITWVMGHDPTDDNPDPNKRRRVVRPAPGSNYRLPEQGLSFTIAEHDETEAGYVTTIRSSEVDAQTITSPPLPVNGDQADSLDACSVLTAILTPNPVWVKEAIDQMAEAGFTKDQARRAKDKLARAIKVGSPTAKEHGWKWELRRSSKDGEDGKDGAFPKGATFATFDPDPPPLDGGEEPEGTP